MYHLLAHQTIYFRNCFTCRWTQKNWETWMELHFPVSRKQIWESNVNESGTWKSGVWANLFIWRTMHDSLVTVWFHQVKVPRMLVCLFCSTLFLFVCLWAVFLHLYNLGQNTLDKMQIFVRSCGCCCPLPPCRTMLFSSKNDRWDTCIPGNNIEMGEGWSRVTKNAHDYVKCIE